MPAFNPLSNDERTAVWANGDYMPLDVAYADIDAGYSMHSDDFVVLDKAWDDVTDDDLYAITCYSPSKFAL